MENKLLIFGGCVFLYIILRIIIGPIARLLVILGLLGYGMYRYG